MPSPPNPLPSPAVVCVQVFLPFVLQDIFTKAVISKSPSIRTKQAKTNVDQKPASRRSPAPAAHGEAAAAAQRNGGRCAPPALRSPSGAPGPRALPPALLAAPPSPVLQTAQSHPALRQPQHVNTICMHLPRNSFLS